MFYTAVLIFVLAITSQVYTIVCPPHYCSRVVCDEGLTSEFCEARGAVLRPKSSFCGCCPTCVTQLGEGSNCLTTLFRGLPPTSSCADGLTCNPKTFKCEQVTESNRGNDCLTMRSTLQSMMGTSSALPVCDADGFYKGRQCNNGNCYCVDKQGSKIQGYDHSLTSTSDDVACGCAREKDAYSKTGLIGRTFDCNQFGDYQEKQCIGSSCYCADRVSGKKLGESVHISDFNELNCRDKRSMLYNGKRCRNNRCSCFDKSGRRILGYDHAQSEYKPIMTCSCAVAKQEYQKTGLIGKMFFCDKYGSYERVQCVGSVCFCADTETGEQVGRSVVQIGHADQLNC